MTAKHIMDAASRRKKVYIELHKKLRAECKPFHKSYTVSPAEDKADRKRAKSADYRLHGDA